MNITSLKIKLLLITIVPFTIGIFVLSGINFEKTQNTLNNTLKKFETTITKEKESLIQEAGLSFTDGLVTLMTLEGKGVIKEQFGEIRRVI